MSRRGKKKSQLPFILNHACVGKHFLLLILPTMSSPKDIGGGHEVVSAITRGSAGLWSTVTVVIKATEVILAMD